MPSPLENQKTLVATMIKLEQSWDLNAVFALHTLYFTHTLLPASIGGPPRNNAEARKHCEDLKPTWKDYKITKKSEVHDAEARTAALHTLTVAETTAGHFEVEAMWLLHFNEDGTKLKGLEQLVDSTAVAELFAMLEAQNAWRRRGVCRWYFGCVPVDWSGGIVKLNFGPGPLVSDERISTLTFLLTSMHGHTRTTLASHLRISVSDPEDCNLAG
ncbi:hypothetical protein B0A48_08546 [Cryoendolithus antarcticus]|uniref:Uncharacterized protein n=1 Tax=Cryoendolithus antarcticus TaxID=1507870 RepID=A0A1V8T699_9PEZI|nr:hypothetical protein B0A48_08546 [Cryoendolithus antarcticus]